MKKMKLLHLCRPWESLLCCLLICSIAYAQGADNLKRIQAAFFSAGSDQVLVAAHRGLHRVYPENSLSAFRHAIEVGVDIIETDVRLSRDGVPVLRHDRTIDRTTNGKGKVEDLALSELRQLRLIDRDSTSRHGILTLKEALELARGRIKVDLDLKVSDLEPVMDVVRETGTEAEVVFFDGDDRVLQKIQAADRKFTLMPRTHSYQQTEQALRAFHPPIVHIGPDFYTHEVVALARRHDARVWINALGEVDQHLRSGDKDGALSGLLGNGASVIQTDEPEIVLAYLRKRGLHL